MPMTKDEAIKILYEAARTGRAGLRLPLNDLLDDKIREDRLVMIENAISKIEKAREAEKIAQAERRRRAWGILEDVVERLVGADENSDEETRDCAESVRQCGQSALDCLEGNDD